MSTTIKIIDGLWRGERKCIDPKAGDADLWIKTWEEMHLFLSEEILVTVEHVKTHRTMKDMSQFEQFVTDGNAKADELAMARAMLDEGFMAEPRAKTIQQQREVYAALQHSASFHCLVEKWKDCEELKPEPKEKLIPVEEKSQETKHRMEWCANASKHRCMRCGRGSKNMKMQGKCTRPKYLAFWVKMWKATCGRTRHGKKNGPAGRILDLVQKKLGICATENGTKTDELLQAGASRHRRVRQDDKTKGP